jgi:hypothetical protein
MQIDAVTRLNVLRALDTHFVRFDMPGKPLARALCGKLVDREIEHDNAPTCETCRAQLEAFEQMEI